MRFFFFKYFSHPFWNFRFVLSFEFWNLFFDLEFLFFDFAIWSLDVGNWDDLDFGILDLGFGAPTVWLSSASTWGAKSTHTFQRGLRENPKG